MDSKFIILKPYVLFATTSIAVASAVILYFYQRRRRLNPPEKWEQVGKVTELYIYPLKSGRRIPVKTADCAKYSFKLAKADNKLYQLRDRELIVYNEKDFEVRTGRTYPKMLFIEVGVHDAKHFVISAPDMEPLIVKMPKREEAKEVYVKCFRDEKIHGLDCGDKAATWFSRYIKGESSGLRLAYHDGVFQRDIETAWKKALKFYKNFTNESAGLFTDLAGGHIINQNSVDDLNKRIGKPSVTVHNFRPNVVVNCPAYAEDEWNWIKIGDVIFQVIKPCTRCMWTTINQETGERNRDGEPLKTLRKYQAIENLELRNVEKNSPKMGIYVGIKKTGSLNVGDPVYICVD